MFEVGEKVALKDCGYSWAGCVAGAMCFILCKTKGLTVLSPNILPVQRTSCWT